MASGCTRAFARAEYPKSRLGRQNGGNAQHGSVDKISEKKEYSDAIFGKLTEAAWNRAPPKRLT
jgi:hypothetical protein